MKLAEELNQLVEASMGYEMGVGDLDDPPNKRVKRNPVKSSFIASVGYDSGGKILDVEVEAPAGAGKGTYKTVVYRYVGVPPIEFKALMNANNNPDYGFSMGKYYNKEIKKNFKVATKFPG
jgi:hypothetical protein